MELEHLLRDSVVLLASAALHVYWALGGTWFLATALNRDVETMPAGILALTWAFVVGMLVTAVAALGRVQLLALPVPKPALAMFLWTVTALLSAGAFFNAILPRLWDRWVFAPLFFVVAALAMVVALPSREAD